MSLRQFSAAHDETGETLAELLVTIAILGIAIVAIVGGLANGILASSAHRDHATTNAVALTAAECLKDRSVAYQQNGNYSSSGCIPSGVTVSTAWWDGASTSPAAFGNGQTTFGLQRLTVSAAATRATESVTILKRRT
jgi:Tfp pilus assembly protein FimT